MVKIGNPLTSLHLFLLLGLLFSCSPFNKIHYRNEKTGENRTAIREMNTANSDTTVAIERDTSGDLSANETSEIIADSKNNENLVLIKKSTERNKKLLVDLKHKSKSLDQVIDKIIILENLSITRNIETPEKSKFRKRFDAIHWIIITFFAGIIVLVVAGTEFFLENKHSQNYFIFAGVLYVLEFILVAIQHFMLPYKMKSQDHDKIFRRRHAFAKVAFIFLLIELVLLVFVLITLHFLSIF